MSVPAPVRPVATAVDGRTAPDAAVTRGNAVRMSGTAHDPADGRWRTAHARGSGHIHPLGSVSHSDMQPV